MKKVNYFSEDFLMKKGFIICMLVLVVSVAFSAERISPYRPGNPALFYSHSNDLALGGNWNGPINDQVSFGWFGVASSHWADFNGDGLDDKVVVQPSGIQWQIVCPYTFADGNIANGDWNPPLGDIKTEWWDNTTQQVIFGDIDGDGIDDNCATSTGAAMFPGGGIDDALVWGGFFSNGVPGVTIAIGSPVPENFTGWNAWGVVGTHMPYLGDINGDGLDDRVLFDPNTFQVIVDFSVMDGEWGTWGDSSADQSYGYGGVAYDMLALSDVNGDGMDDVVIIRDPNDPGMDYFQLFAWYTEPGGVLPEGGPDAIALAGTRSLGDIILFADIDPVPGDVDFDGDVDMNDLESIQGQWMEIRGLDNPGFEDPVLADGLAQPLVIPEWDNNMGVNNTDPNLVEIRNPAAGSLQPSEGDNYVYLLNGAVGNIAQPEGRVDPNTAYNFLVDVGVDSSFVWYQVKMVLMDDSDPENLVFSEVSVLNHVTNPPIVDGWLGVSVNFDSTTDPQYNDNVILFVLEGNEIAYDNVRFTKTKYPDVNGDNVIDYMDFKAVAEDWLKNVPLP